MSTNEPELPVPEIVPAEVVEEVIFKPYLDAVAISSNRSRSAIYFLLIAVVTVFAAYRYCGQPDWIDARLGTLQYASTCISDGKDLSIPPCKEPVEYTLGFLKEFPSTIKNTSLPNGDPNLDVYLGTAKESRADTVNQLNEQINELIKVRTEAMAIRIPILGFATDFNDLALIGGIILVCVLYIVQKCLDSEALNLERAKRRAEGNKFESNCELLLMQQVLSVQGKVRSSLYVGYMLFAAPILVETTLVYTDITSESVGKMLIGFGGWLAVVIAEVLALLLMLLVASLCVLRWNRLMRAWRSIGVCAEPKRVWLTS